MIRMISVSLALALAAVLVAACREDVNTGRPAPAGKTLGQAATSDSSNAAAPLGEEVEYPLVGELTAAAMDFHAAAVKNSDHADATCVLMDISIELAALRVNGGCPRQEGPAETWSAQ